MLNLSEFVSNVISNTHFLYWGEKISLLEDGQEIKLQVRDLIARAACIVNVDHLLNMCKET